MKHGNCAIFLNETRDFISTRSSFALSHNSFSRLTNTDPPTLEIRARAGNKDCFRKDESRFIMAFPTPLRHAKWKQYTSIRVSWKSNHDSGMNWQREHLTKGGTGPWIIWTNTLITRSLTLDKTSTLQLHGRSASNEWSRSVAIFIQIRAQYKPWR